MTTNDNTAAQWSRLLSEAITRPGLLLKAYSAFHGYSIGNQVLALVQCEQRGIEPGPIATYPAWQEKGRHVRKGERALTLCMPLTHKNREQPDESYTTFAYKPRWFVLAQTEGEPITHPDPPAWSKAEALAALDITEIAFAHTDGNTQGYAKDRTIAINPLAAIPHKTTFHELAHVLLGHTAESQIHDDERTPRSLREAEAESVALICCETLQLDGAVYARGYIQNWLQGQPIPERSAQKIFHAADRIIRAGQPPTERKPTEH
jgi:antirestriction protein ArdC